MQTHIGIWSIISASLNDFRGGRLRRENYVKTALWFLQGEQALDSDVSSVSLIQRPGSCSTYPSAAGFLTHKQRKGHKVEVCRSPDLTCKYSPWSAILCVCKDAEVAPYTQRQVAYVLSGRKAGAVSHRVSRGHSKPLCWARAMPLV